MKLSCAGARSSAPEIKKSPNGRFFLFLCKDADENRRESRSNRRKKADDSTPVVRMHNFARWRSNPVIRPRKNSLKKYTRFPRIHM